MDKTFYKRKLLFCITGVTAFVLSFLMIACIVLAQTEQKIIRVGAYEIPGFYEVDENGVSSGYNCDFTYELSEVTGWTFEFVPINNFYEGLDKLKSGEIDFFSPVQNYEEYLPEYGYTDKSFCYGYTVLVTGKDNEKYDYEEFNAFQNMKVAIIKDSIFVINFDEYKDTYGFDVEYMYYDTQQDALQAVENGEAEAAVVSLMAAGEEYKILARLERHQLYYITYDNYELLKEMNDAMSQVYTMKPTIIEDLIESHFPVYRERYLSFEQKEYIKQLEIINVGYVTDSIPVSYMDKETGEFCGIERDILDKIQEFSGLKFNYVPLPGGSVDFKYLSSNDIRITAGVVYSSTNRRAHKIALTLPYISMDKVFVGRKGVNFEKNNKLRLAISTGSQTLGQTIKEKYPEFEQIMYDSIEGCFEAVVEGEADILLGNQYVVDYWMARPRYETLDILSLEGLLDDHCFAIVDHLNEEEHSECSMLKEVLDISVLNLSDADVNVITMNNTINHHYDYTFRDLLYHNRVYIRFLILLITVIVFALVKYFRQKNKSYRALKESEKRLYSQQKRYEFIMEKAEEIIFEIDIKTGTTSVSESMYNTFGWSLYKSGSFFDVEQLMKCWKVELEDYDKLKQAYVETLEQKKETECVVRLYKKDKGYVWCKVYRYPIVDDKGNIDRIMGKIVNIDEQTKSTEKLKKQTRLDHMTGLLNKNSFIAGVEEYISKGEFAGYALVFIDLDHFKQLNDTLGHLTGDNAIKNTAVKLTKLFRETDLLARFGGDEFCVFVKDIDVDDLRHKLENVRVSLQETYTEGVESVEITASIGAVYYDAIQKDVQEIIGRADEAVYEAKNTGRNKVVLMIGS